MFIVRFGFSVTARPVHFGSSGQRDCNASALRHVLCQEEGVVRNILQEKNLKFLAIIQARKSRADIERDGQLETVFGVHT
jgi:hypothetical protein